MHLPVRNHFQVINFTLYLKKLSFICVFVLNLCASEHPNVIKINRLCKLDSNSNTVLRIAKCNVFIQDVRRIFITDVSFISKLNSIEKHFKEQEQTIHDEKEK